MDQVVAQALAIFEKLRGRRATQTSNAVVSLPTNILDTDKKPSDPEQEDTEAA
jgi:hypothetical protein